MKTYFSILLLLSCLSTNYILANGDPTISLSALNRSANPSPRPIVDIQILREDLYIEPGINTKVKVKYVLNNTSGKDYEDIDYGFPVDYMGSGMTNAQTIGDLYSESIYTVGWQDFYIKSMSFSMNDKTLPYTLSPETVVTKTDRKTLKAEYIELMDVELDKDQVEQLAAESDIARRWFYTKFSIKANQICTLEVEYTLRNYFSISLYNSNTIYSLSNPSTGFGNFFYDMSPAQYWGDGTTKELSVVIDYRNILGTHNKNIEPEIETLGLPFEKKDYKMIFSAKNFNFKDSEPIELRYYADYYYRYNDLLKYRILPSTYTLTVSDQLESYPVSNLSDLDLSTAWATKTNNLADKKLKITFDQPTAVGAIVLVGGYLKSADTYINNAQPKKITVSLSDDWQQSCFLDDKSYNNNIARHDNIISNDNILDYSIIFTQPKYTEYERAPIKEITISIDDIYPGAKYDDLCITEIILLTPNYTISNDQ